jgi:uncharacterized protein
VALAAIPFGVGIGLSLGMLGGGGSVLAVPVLVYILGQNVHQATTASLVVVTAGALVGGVRHARDGHVCWRHAFAFTAGALPGAFAGTALGQAVSGSALIAGFALIMFAAAGAMWRKAPARAGAAETPAPRCPPLRLARGLAAGLLIGLMTGFFGVGGGFLIVPTLTLALAFSMRPAIGTSLAIITATSVIALAAHLAAGRTLDFFVTIAMIAPVIAGALVGGHLARRLPQRLLGTGFATLVVLVGAYLLVSTTVLGGPPGG